MDNLQRVTFRFDSDTEVRYLDRLPEVGDRVAHGDTLWVVDAVEDDAVGTLVDCEDPSEARSRRSKSARNVLAWGRGYG